MIIHTAVRDVGAWVQVELVYIHLLLDQTFATIANQINPYMSKYKLNKSIIPCSSLSRSENLVRAAELTIGECYFFAMFIDREFIYPTFTTVVYLGVNAFGDPEKQSVDEYCFQDAQSYSEHGNLFNSTNQAAKADFRILHSLDYVYDRQGLSKWLLEEHSPYLRG